MKTTKEIIDEMYEEEHIQDMIFMQEAEMDGERDVLGSVVHTPQYKRIFSQKFKARNRRNNYRFAKKNTYFPFMKLPF